MTQLPKPRATVVYDVWGVYKDYDGYAPDTPTLVLCATEEVAKSVAKYLSDNDSFVLGGESVELRKPFVEGRETFSSYLVKKEVVEERNKEDIALTLPAALEKLSE